jgi:predicted dehydrogenase
LPHAAANNSQEPRARSLGEAEISIALVGCGARGTAAAVQALATAGRVKLVALADAFADRLDTSLTELARRAPERVDVPEDRRFVGFDAYERAIDVGADVVLLATPPGFRPIHFEYAVERGKHVFMEKPVAVDSPGVRRVLRAAEDAAQRELKVGVGLQRRHSRRYRETVRRLHDGAIGDIHLVRCYGNLGGVWVRPREEHQTEMQYQMRNWYYFNWLSGDCINEQHVDNLDVANWVKGAYPVEAQGQGGRQVRTGPDHGQIYDHHMVEFTYADGTTLLSQCRQIPNTWGRIDELVNGSRGRARMGAGFIEESGGTSWRFDDEDPDPYQLEQDALFRAVRDGLPHNEAESAAKSTLTAILGRMATYSGKVVRWDDALSSQLSLAPRIGQFDWDVLPPARLRKNGGYFVPLPGQVRAR